MAYTPTVWKTGDVITAVKLNKAEDGIADAYDVMYVDFAFNAETHEYVTESVLADVLEAIGDGKYVVFRNAISEGTYAFYQIVEYDSSSISIVNIYNNQGSLAMDGLKWTSEGFATWPTVG